MTVTYVPTSERVEEDSYRSTPGDYLIYLMHIATYDWATQRIKNARVLDFGCGAGYGSFRMSSQARSVVGVDVAADAVAYATDRYRAKNLAFQQISPVEVAPLPFDDHSFDVVTSFQVIEHVPSPDAYLAAARRVLKPGGTLLCVTPDRQTRLFPRQRPWNVWHLDEFSRSDLAALIGKQFAVEEVLGMTGRPDVIKIELDRVRMLRLTTYPFTFPGAPERWRTWGLRLLKRYRGRGPAQSGADEAHVDFGFGVADIEISATADPSMNLIVVGRA